MKTIRLSQLLEGQPAGTSRPNVQDNATSMVHVDLDPRAAIQPLPPAELRRWLEAGVEIIDLNSGHRDTVIQPTTWH